MNYQYNDLDHLYIIWPEFEGCEKGEKVLPEGTAKMIIIMEPMIEYHKKRMTIGTKGFFMEGSKKVGECEIIELNFLP